MLRKFHVSASEVWVLFVASAGYRGGMEPDLGEACSSPRVKDSAGPMSSSQLGIELLCL